MAHRLRRAKQVKPDEEKKDNNDEAAASTPGPGDKADGEGGKKSGKASEESKEVSPANGPRDLRKRGCTDCCCVLLFLVFYSGMLAITYLAWEHGDPYQILDGQGSPGHSCGGRGVEKRARCGDHGPGTALPQPAARP